MLNIGFPINTDPVDVMDAVRKSFRTLTLRVDLDLRDQSCNMKGMWENTTALTTNRKQKQLTLESGLMLMLESSVHKPLL